MIYHDVKCVDSVKLNMLAWKVGLNILPTLDRLASSLDICALVQWKLSFIHSYWPIVSTAKVHICLDSMPLGSNLVSILINLMPLGSYFVLREVIQYCFCSTLLFPVGYLEGKKCPSASDIALMSATSLSSYIYETTI